MSITKAVIIHYRPIITVLGDQQTRLLATRYMEALHTVLDIALHTGSLPLSPVVSLLVADVADLLKPGTRHVREDDGLHRIVLAKHHL